MYSQRPFKDTDNIKQTLEPLRHTAVECHVAAKWRLLNHDPINPLFDTAPRLNLPGNHQELLTLNHGWLQAAVSRPMSTRSGGIQIGSVFTEAKWRKVNCSLKHILFSDLVTLILYIPKYLLCDFLVPPDLLELQTISDFQALDSLFFLFYCLLKIQMLHNGF